jgi:hypothetical protein
MGAGSYSLDVALHRDSQEVCWVRSAAIFEVDRPLMPYREGMVDLVARCQIASKRELGPLPESAARKVELDFDRPPRVNLASEKIIVPVRLNNRSHVILSSDDWGRTYGSYHWLSADSEEKVNDGIRSSLPRDVWPNETVSFEIHVANPPHFGRWRLQIRVVQEGVRWHEGPGFEASMPPDMAVDFLNDGRIVFPECQPVA